ncbi:hypothetical protein ACIQNG_26295 [Streptomyces sp. NPDC091377]|uniref:hypothetical protein n=1 Tax=Streptomyces sp. NPDC091377 TaxID=3365995 RepID=UPI0037F67DB6
MSIAAGTSRRADWLHRWPLSKEILRKYEEEHADDLLGFDLDPGLSPEERLFLDKYKRQVDAIAGRTAVQLPAT